MTTRAQWEKKYLRRFVLTLHREYDADMIEFLESKENVRQYLMDLVREDMNEETPKDPKSGNQ